MTDLLERDSYLSAGVHLGSRDKTKDMERFIFKTRPDGLSIIDLKKVDERIGVAASFLSGYDDIMVVGRKENSHLPIEKLAEVVDAKSVTGRFMPGTLTNPSLDTYHEPDVLLVADPLVDKQAMEEAIKRKIPIVAVCDTFTDLDYIDLVIPGNNKGRKSLGVIFYLLTREILKERGEINSDTDFDYEIEDFVGEEK
ncbi:MAG: 30S ribosomal protein S2 [Candidatus Aenigmatarchaeota archaeon]